MGLEFGSNKTGLTTRLVRGILVNNFYLPGSGISFSPVGLL